MSASAGQGRGTGAPGMGERGGLSVQLTLVPPSPAADRKGGSKILEEATDKRKMMEIL